MSPGILEIAKGRDDDDLNYYRDFLKKIHKKLIM